MPRADWKQMDRDYNSQNMPDLEQKGACGSTLYQVQKILQSREEPTWEADAEEDTGIFTNLLGLDGLLFCPLAPELHWHPHGSSCAGVESNLFGLPLWGYSACWSKQSYSVAQAFLCQCSKAQVFIGKTWEEISLDVPGSRYRQSLQPAPSYDKQCYTLLQT